MSRLQTIENALKEINETVFQELCDSFLILQNPNYSVFSRTGSQIGKQKTIKGTPDSFFLLQNGRYRFIEYSTNITSGLTKLKKDIEKCLNEEKTGIPIDDIEEIVLCTNFNLKLNEVQILKGMLTEFKTDLVLFTLDSLAIELHLNHRDLANKYLGLPLDTGQIVSIETFIEEYNRASKGIATPIDNHFLHREKEMEEILEGISNSDFVILTGPAGVGKTKLAIETIEKYIEKNSDFDAYCISYKSHSLLDDLHLYLDFDKNYILFIDDANRVDAFNQITGFYRRARKGKLKVVMTVRDYAFYEIGSLCIEFSPIRIDLHKLNDQQIVDIIKSEPFKILNPDYQREIVRIADGNPRLAIMAALLAKAEQNLYVLYDVSSLFETYFSTFIKDQVELTYELHVKILGVIAFFYTLPYKDKEVITLILGDFGINYYDFIDTIDKFEKWELIEIQFDHVKIPEQNLSTYFFYKAFIKENILSFNILLNRYFVAHKERFKECVISANNTFGYQNVMQKLKPELKKYWNSVKTNQESTYSFLSVFWFYLQDETLEYFYDYITNLPSVNSPDYNVFYAHNAFSYNRNETIELLSRFFKLNSSAFLDSLELAFEFARKCPQHLPELIHKIRESLTFDREDENSGFSRQETLFSLLIKGLNNEDNFYSIVFYELAKTFLGFTFHHFKGGRKHTVYWYDYSIPLTKSTKKFRTNIWEAIDNYYLKQPKKSLELLMFYSSNYFKEVKDVMEFDIRFIISIIKKYLNKDFFDDCHFVQKFIMYFERNSIYNPIFPYLKKHFTNRTYETFLKIDWDRLRDKEIYEFDNLNEYEKLKEREIRSSFLFISKEQLKIFYDDFVFLKNKAENDWNYTKTLDIIIDENFKKSFDLGIYFLDKIITHKNVINYIPRIIFNNQLKTMVSMEKIQNLILSKSYQLKLQWIFSFYEHIDDSLVSEKHIEEILQIIEETEETTTIYFDSLENFLEIDPNFFVKILKIITRKNTAGLSELRIIGKQFVEYFTDLGNHIDLIKKTYLQQYKYDFHFDYNSEVLLEILKKEPEFLIEYIKVLYSEKDKRFVKDHLNLGTIWDIDKIEIQVEEVFNFVIENELYFGILEHFCNTFFSNLKDKHTTRADNFLLNYVKNNYNDHLRMNVVVDIVRHSRTELFEKVLLTYLSLNQVLESFSQIWWIGNGGTFSGDVIIGDIEASEWENISDIINKAQIGIKLIPIKRYIVEEIENCIERGKWERKCKFLKGF